MYFYQVNNSLPNLDFAIDMAITPFINQFKRDSEKYVLTVEKRKLAGSKGGKQKLANASKSKQSVENLADSVNVNDSVSDSKSDSKNKTIFNPTDYLLSYGASIELIEGWFEIRKKKKGVNTEIAMKGFIREVEASKQNINAVLKRCIEKSWVGFEADWVKGQNLGIINSESEKKEYIIYSDQVNFTQKKILAKDFEKAKADVAGGGYILTEIKRVWE